MSDRRRSRPADVREAPAAPDVVGLRHVSEATIYLHVFSNADREVGGVLIGRVPRAGTAPMITGAIPALKATERRATLTFTQDAWEHVHRALDTEFPPGDQIVGWYHSHPGFGIFLSEHDLFIHRNFFNGRSQIALVIDPHACTEGVFVWAGDRLELLFERPTPMGWHAREPQRRRPAMPAAAQAVEIVPIASERYPLAPVFVAAVAGAAAGFALACVL